MLKAVLKKTHVLGATPVFRPVAQGVNAELVDQLCALGESDAEFQALVKDAAERGFELTRG
jgi:hypothetical protein